MSDEAKQPPANKAMHLTALRAAGDRQSVGQTGTGGPFPPKVRCS